MTVFIQEFLDAIVTSLANVASTTLTIRDLQSGLVAPHRYVWEPTTIEDVTDTKFAYRNKNPKCVATDQWNFTVHCWGATYNDCQAMRLALREALKVQSGGRAAFEFGTATWSFPEWALSGYVLSQQIGLMIGATEMTLPTTPLSYPSQISANTYPTVTITAFEALPVTSTPGDGLLENGE